MQRQLAPCSRCRRGFCDCGSRICTGCNAQTYDSRAAARFASNQAPSQSQDVHPVAYRETEEAFQRLTRFAAKIASELNSRNSKPYEFYNVSRKTATERVGRRMFRKPEVRQVDVGEDRLLACEGWELWSAVQFQRWTRHADTTSRPGKIWYVKGYVDFKEEKTLRVVLLSEGRLVQDEERYFYIAQKAAPPHESHSHLLTPLDREVAGYADWKWGFYKEPNTHQQFERFRYGQQKERWADTYCRGLSAALSRLRSKDDR